jgi:hypothetical protein
MLVAEQQFRRIIGYRDLAKLVIAIERHAILPPPRTPTARRSPSPLPSDRQPRGSPSKFHDDPDILMPAAHAGHEIGQLTSRAGRRRARERHRGSFLSPIHRRPTIHPGGIGPARVRHRPTAALWWRKPPRRAMRPAVGVWRGDAPQEPGAWSEGCLDRAVRRALGSPHWVLGCPGRRRRV